MGQKETQNKTKTIHMKMKRNKAKKKKRKKRTKMKQITEEETHTQKNKIKSAQLRYLKITNQIRNQNAWDSSKTTLRGKTEDLDLLVCKGSKRKVSVPSQAAWHRGRPAALGQRGLPQWRGQLTCADAVGQVLRPQTRWRPQQRLQG